MILHELMHDTLIWTLFQLPFYLWMYTYLSCILIYLWAPEFKLKFVVYWKHTWKMWCRSKMIYAEHILAVQSTRFPYMHPPSVTLHLCGISFFTSNVMFVFYSFSLDITFFNIGIVAGSLWNCHIFAFKSELSNFHTVGNFILSRQTHWTHKFEIKCNRGILWKCQILQTASFGWLNTHLGVIWTTCKVLISPAVSVLNNLLNVFIQVFSLIFGWISSGVCWK